jgi:hypothetical protein
LQADDERLAIEPATVPGKLVLRGPGASVGNQILHVGEAAKVKT